MKKKPIRIMMRLTTTTAMMIMKIMKTTTMMIGKGMDKHNPQESGQKKIFHVLPYFTHCKNLQWKISGNVYLKCSIKYSKKP